MKDNTYSSQGKYQTRSMLLAVTMCLSGVFLVATLKLENRRMGYQLLKLSQSEKLLFQANREKKSELANLAAPERIERLNQSIEKIQGRSLSVQIMRAQRPEVDL
ncbi:MAG: hypothetical protein COT74_08860 [Bdellovibrionales bacterium CG10_big_fil_rev_8_21_14_0_10_45_34]|nr:MAG: hypothetical protein COT74_08860 [Bdellovibrionales bacterium CG10_big_fil_rev_8_21_14_0_10_45_34]